MLAAFDNLIVYIHASGAVGLDEAGTLHLFSQSAVPGQWNFLALVYGKGKGRCTLNG